MTPAPRSYGQYEVLLRKPTDQYRWFMLQIPYLIDRAREAANGDAYSYRDFNVGAVGYGINEYSREFDVQSAGNLKRRPGKEKVCAEKKVLGRLKKTGMDRVIGFVGVGATDPQLIKEVTGKSTPTLHPCSVCLEMFRDSPMIDANTLVVNAGVEEDIYEVHSVGEQWKMYGGNVTEPPLVTDRLRIGFEDIPYRVMAYERMVAAVPSEAGELPPDTVRAQLAHVALTGNFTALYRL